MVHPRRERKIMLQLYMQRNQNSEEMHIHSIEQQLTEERDKKRGTGTHEPELQHNVSMLYQACNP